MFKKCNDQKLLDVQTSCLEQESENMLGKSHHTTSPAIKNSPTQKAIQDLRVSIDGHIIGKYKHNCRQLEIKTQTDNSNIQITRSCAPLPQKTDNYFNIK